MSETIKVHLLDVGPDEYGDAILCQFGNKSVLIDGAHPGDTESREGHPSIPEQLGELLGQEEPYTVDLLIVSHAHQDHIGCLPKMVRREQLRARWALVADPQLGWGRAPGEDRDGLTQDERALALAAAVREEVRTKKTSIESLDAMITDARTLEDRYLEMLAILEEQGTRVARFGRDTARTRELVEAFADIGLKILGPSQAHLLLCCDIINGISRDSILHFSNAFQQDAASQPADVYRRYFRDGGNLDSLDAPRPGPAINLQSIVTQFQIGEHKFLFAGDFQFEKPEVDNTDLEKSVRRLRQIIRREAPYSFVKISHHGSYNAFSEEFLRELGRTKIFGMCAGEHSSHHPNHRVLAVLDEYANSIKWARTDRNGLVTISFGAGEPQIRLSKGRLNDARRNDLDVSPAAVAVPSPQPTTVPAPKTSVPSQSSSSAVEKPSFKETFKSPIPEPQVLPTNQSEMIEINAKVPHLETRVTLTIDVQPGGNGSQKNIIQAQGRQTENQVGGGSGQKDKIASGIAGRNAISIASGRDVSDLLFVTNSETLTQNIGQTETAQVIGSLPQNNLVDLPPGLTATEAGSIVRKRLLQSNEIKGVVIIGGYDAVPAQILNCIPPNLEARISEDNEDPDRFIVWSDDVYADLDGDTMPNLPVSRIPDGRSAKLVFKALQVGNNRNNPPLSNGIRNIRRPFADVIFDKFSSGKGLLTSKNTVFNNPQYDLKCDSLYLMLHGDYTDTRKFWGEGTLRNTEAMNIGNIPEEFNGTVFTGCCWGALTVDPPAGLLTQNNPFGVRTPESSIALSFLERGAVAFIGCTGAHYSPIDRPYDYFGGPMHDAFWRNYNQGQAPAEALFNAKIEYLSKMPHNRTKPLQEAIEHKILRQFTCLGLGW